MDNKCGTLYLCPTPIGNLEDVTPRVLRILGEVDLVAAEDTRHTGNLLRHFAIATPLISYHEHNKRDRGLELLQRLQGGENVAIVSDAGMPGISDPGEELVQLAVAAAVPVVALPGPNAALTALVASGLPAGLFTFVGFLPRTQKKRRELLRDLAALPHTLVFYEAPHRLKATLGELQAELGNRTLCAARELTKRYEEYIRGTVAEVLAHFAAVEPRGEFTLVVAGADPAAAEEEAGQRELSEAELREKVEALVAAGQNKKDAIRMVASQEKVAKRVVYQAVIKQ